MKNLLSVLLCFLLIGCASSNANIKEYTNQYNEAVTSGHSAVIVKEGDFQVMQEGVQQELNSVGYNKVLYTSPTEPFVVLAKSVDYGSPLLNGAPDAHKIFLKYTKIDAGHTRIDIVNAGTQMPAKNEIDADIQKLADLIKNS